MQICRINILVACCFFIQSFLIAQANTLVTGNISNTLVKIIQLNIDQKYLNGDSQKHYSNILEDGSFAFAVQINYPQLVNINLGQRYGTIYLEPGDTLDIKTDDLGFSKNFQFAKKSAANNRYLVEYYKQNPTEANPFNMIQYRQGIHWYNVSPAMDAKMRTLSIEEFVQVLTTRRERASRNLLNYQQSQPGKLSDDFVAFMEAEIKYDCAYHLIAHGHIFQKIKSIPEEYFNFVKSESFNTNQLGNIMYRNFISASIDKLYMLSGAKAANPYLGQYALVAERLNGLSKEFMQSKLIAAGFSKIYIEETIPIYQDFLENSDSPFEAKVANQFEKSMQNAVGTPASNFVIKNGDGEVSLSSLHGKTVYLSFWASWCKPCIKKMLELKSLDEEMKDSNIEFVHISFDRSEKTWENTIRNYGFKGIHALAIDGVDSELAKAYGVRAIPQYYIIDNQGQFAAKPTINSSEELKDKLITLSSK